MQENNPSPLVSIIIPTYNYAKYLPIALESCFRQTYKNLEIIVVDDGSTDNTREVIERYRDRIIFISQENAGVSAARNRGIQSAAGDFIAFLDADDYMLEDAIQTRLDAFIKNPEAGAVITETFSMKGERLSCHPGLKKDTVSRKFYEDLLSGSFPFATCASLIRSDVAKQHKFPSGLSNGEDVAYFTKIFFTTPVCYLTKPTVVTVWHGDSLRHNIEIVKKQGIKLVEEIFDDPFYGGVLEYLRKDFTARRYLELFKKLYRYGEKNIAREYYMKALSLKPANIFKIDYLIKFIKSLV
jgi:glycosyltransferase involved in cell wall biosynthesis